MGNIIGILKLTNMKMYIVGAAVIAIGLAEGVFGIDIPGVDVGSDWLAWVLAGLGIGATKAAINKVV